MAAALFAAWSGDPAVVVASPPGAGKTRLVVHLAEQLHRRAQLKIAIAAQTRSQALDVANRAAAIGGRVGLLGARESQRPEGLDRRATYLQGVAQLRTWRGIVVATTARWLWVNEREYTADVAIADEAWQLTYADLGGLGPLSAQVVLVGDPGQIAPVVTGDSRRWRDWSAGPQRAAPEALLAAYPEAVTRLRLPHTWRLGPVTTALIQPAFYADLPFDSVRPPRHLLLAGTPLPELCVDGDPAAGRTGRSDPGRDRRRPRGRAARQWRCSRPGRQLQTTWPGGRRGHHAARRAGQRRGGPALRSTPES